MLAISEWLVSEVMEATEAIGATEAAIILCTV